MTQLGYNRTRSKNFFCGIRKIYKDNYFILTVNNQITTIGDGGWCLLWSQTSWHFLLLGLGQFFHQASSNIVDGTGAIYIVAIIDTIVNVSDIDCAIATIGGIVDTVN